jgi:hypothetical protein
MTSCVRGQSDMDQTPLSLSDWGYLVIALVQAACFAPSPRSGVRFIGASLQALALQRVVFS